MKFIFLNAWGGRVRDALGQFLQEQVPHTDVFCLQEADGEMKSLAKECFADYQEIAAYKYLTEDDNFPQAVFVKSPMSIGDSRTMLEQEPGVGLGLYVQVHRGRQVVHIGNFHGVSRPGDKLDDPGRLAQSQRLLEFFEDKAGPKIIGGDFNLLPETQSIEMFEENGYRNLIREFRIRTTRNRLAWDAHPESKQYFSDYIFVSAEVNLKTFSVLNLEISDHLPLILEIEP